MQSKPSHHTSANSICKSSLSSLLVKGFYNGPLAGRGRRCTETTIIENLINLASTSFRGCCSFIVLLIIADPNVMLCSHLFFLSFCFIYIYIYIFFFFVCLFVCRHSSGFSSFRLSVSIRLLYNTSFGVHSIFQSFEPLHSSQRIFSLLFIS